MVNRQDNAIVPRWITEQGREGSELVVIDGAFRQDLRLAVHGNNEFGRVAWIVAQKLDFDPVGIEVGVVNRAD